MKRSPTETEIRTATEADLDALLPLFDAYRSFFTGKEQTPNSRPFLKQRLQNQDSAIFMAFTQNEATGFLQLYPLFSSWHATRIWFLSDLYIVESARKSGIGKRLVESAKAFAHNTNSRSIMVEIPHTEPHLVAFYESLAFTRDKHFDLYRHYIEK